MEGTAQTCSQKVHDLLDDTRSTHPRHYLISIGPNAMSYREVRIVFETSIWIDLCSPGKQIISNTTNLFQSFSTALLPTLFQRNPKTKTCIQSHALSLLHQKNRMNSFELQQIMPPLLSLLAATLSNQCAIGLRNRSLPSTLPPNVAMILSLYLFGVTHLRVHLVQTMPLTIIFGS